VTLHTPESIRVAGLRKLADIAFARLAPALAEYDRRAEVFPVIGFFYSIPAWLRYCRIADAYDQAHDAYHNAREKEMAAGAITRTPEGA
jgi:hypothetical protein